ncbi:MAG: hypothetical protein JKY54_08975 [Flavobacteriales bacterium]|nr:hypothetical protein [Flavobacteriales bacterium]
MMSRLIIAGAAIVFTSFFLGGRNLKYQDLGTLLITGDASGIEKAGYHFWKTDEDGFLGYQKDNYQHQIWVNPHKELHFSSEGSETLDGSIPSTLRVERFNDGPVYVVFIYPNEDADVEESGTASNLEEVEVELE